MAGVTFTRIALFATPDDMAAGEDRAGQISATEDDNTLLYIDSPLGDIDLGGKPTIIWIFGTHAFAAVNTLETKASSSGKLVAIDLSTRAITAEWDLGGQPDSAASAKDGAVTLQMPMGQIVKLSVKDETVDCAGPQKIDVTGLAAVSGNVPKRIDVNAGRARSSRRFGKTTASW